MRPRRVAPKLVPAAERDVQQQLKTTKAKIR
jgi:hypothetical protein